MFHKSELGDFQGLLPCDEDGNLPDPEDDWRLMKWGLDDIDLCDADAVELLDGIWWPQLVDLVARVRQKTREVRVQ